MCQEGSKMVLLVTGLCSEDCYYCPLSLEKQGKRVTYANEKPVEKDEDVLNEAKSISARGTGMTGGDPLLEMDKAVHYIRLLKGEFGERHNIHLYTSTTDPKKLVRLAGAGLDEIRFHPPADVWDRLGDTGFVTAITDARHLGLRTGIEVPAIPGHETQIAALLRSVIEAGAQFINLNELEFSESNWKELKNRGYAVKDDVSSAVAGSEETALNIIRSVDSKVTVHYCSSSFKDATQLRKRLLRRAKNSATPLDIINHEGMFIKGVIECGSPESLARKLAREYKIPKGLIRYDREKSRVELAAWILEEIYDQVEGEAFIVEEYPTADRLEVERRPLGPLDVRVIK